MKTFGELQVGDVAYFVMEECGDEIMFARKTVTEFFPRRTEDEVLISFEHKQAAFYPKNRSNQFGMVFTNEAEAKEKYRQLVNEKIKYHQERLNYFKKLMKTFGDLKIGDSVYLIETTLVNVELVEKKVVDVKEDSEDEIVIQKEGYLPSSYPKNECHYGDVYANEDEAKARYKEEVASRIDYLKERLNYLENLKV